MPYWNEMIVPEIEKGKKILIVAHGNSLRALIKHLDCVSDQDISNLNIPTGFPLVYDLDLDLNSKKHYYLGSSEDIKKATESVAFQGQEKKNFN